MADPREDIRQDCVMKKNHIADLAITMLCVRLQSLPDTIAIEKANELIEESFFLARAFFAKGMANRTIEIHPIDKKGL